MNSLWCETAINFFTGNKKHGFQSFGFPRKNPPVNPGKTPEKMKEKKIDVCKSTRDR
jgi:hypothetical protein